MTQQIALVTGASRGIGAATAKRLARQGYVAAINYLNNKNAANKVKSAIEIEGGQAFLVPANIGDAAAVAAMFEIIDQQGLLTALVNNAGVNGGVTPVADLSHEQLNTVFATNVFGSFYCSQAAIKRMKQNGGGSIVNVTSEAARFGGNQMAAYASAKAAINTFTIALAREVAADNIRVNAVSPGVISTDIHSQSSPERIQQLLQSLPMGRMGKPEEVAETIAWLLSSAASFVSGSIIPISGAR